MIPRPNIHGLDIATPPTSSCARRRSKKRSRLPSFADPSTRWWASSPSRTSSRPSRVPHPVLERLIRPGPFVPPDDPHPPPPARIPAAPRDLALAVDQLGQIMGLVTMKDVLEEIVEEIRDEGEAPGLPFASRCPAPIHRRHRHHRDLREHVGIPLEDRPLPDPGRLPPVPLGTVPCPARASASETMSSPSWKRTVRASSR